MGGPLGVSIAEPDDPLSENDVFPAFDPENSLPPSCCGRGVPPQPEAPDATETAAVANAAMAREAVRMRDPTISSVAALRHRRRRGATLPALARRPALRSSPSPLARLPARQLARALSTNVLPRPILRVLSSRFAPASRSLAASSAARAHARGLVATAAAIVVVLVFGGIPGAALRWAPDSLTSLAPPLPAPVTDRNATLAVAVQAPCAPSGTHARVRAFAIVGDRAYVADSGDTDAQGRTRLAGLPPGEAWVVADAPGCARGSTHLALGAFDARDVAIALEPAHSIRVTVRDDAGALVAADIEVLSPGDPLPVGARAGSDGLAVVGRLAKGPWRITARAPGYDEAAGRAAQDGDTVALVLHKLGALIVSVTDANSRPVAGARVVTAGAALWPPRGADTDVSGEVRIRGLMAGVYAIRATKNADVSPIELGLPLDRGEERHVALRLAPGRTVAVLATDGAGGDADAVAGARVTLVEGGVSPFPLEATTDKKGRARLGPIAAGFATLAVHADGFVPIGALPVADPAPAETHVVLVRSGALVGTVVDSHGDPVGGATIEIAGTDVNGGPIFDDPRRTRFQTAHFDAMLAGPAPFVGAGELGVVPGPVPPIPLAGAALGSTAALQPIAVPSGSLGLPGLRGDPWVTRDDGTFRATPASPGRVRAIVHHPQYVEAESEVVSLAPGGEAEVRVVLHEGGFLEGRVLDARDMPVAGARVFVAAVRGTIERTTRTASDGTFAFAALPDSVTLSASANDDETPDTRTTLSIPEGGRQEVILHLPEPRDPVAVTVTDDRGYPIGAAQITASSLQVESPLRTTAFTNAQGEAEVRRARGLRLRVEVHAPSYAPRILTTDGSANELRIDLAAAERATGEVLAARGRDPVPGAEVTLTTDLGTRRTTTDTKGEFSLGDLAAGTANLRVRAAGFAPVGSTFVIPENRGRRAFAIPSIALVAEGVVEGDVVDGHGDPVVGARIAKDHVPTWLLAGANPRDVAVSDSNGRFTLHELPAGTLSLEAYAPDVGRGRIDDVRVVDDRTTTGVHIVIAPGAEGAPSPGGPPPQASVAVTLGETGPPVEVVVTSVVESSEAERAGVAAGDVLLAVDDVPVATMEQARSLLSGPLSDEVLLRLRRGDRSFVLRTARDRLRR